MSAPTLIRTAARLASCAALLLAIAIAALVSSVSTLALTAFIWLFVLPIGLLTAAVWAALGRETATTTPGGAQR